MIIEIGQLAALLALLAAVLKLVDRLMSGEQKKRLGEDLRRRLKKENTSVVFVAKMPIIAIERILAAVSTNPRSGNISWKRASSVSVILTAMSLVSAGILTDTFLGFEKSPSEAYRQEIRNFEMAVTAKHGLETSSEEERREVEQYNQDMSRILQVAKHPFARWISLTVVATILVLISIVFTTWSILFATKTTRAIATTEQPLLVAGAVLLNGFVVFAVFLGELLALTVASSIWLLFLFAILGVLVELGLMLGVAALSGFGLFAWITAPIWLKALAAASVIPFLLIVVAIALTIVIFPVKSPLHSFVNLLLRRAVTYREGVVAFFAATFFCLAAAVAAANNLIS